VQLATILLLALVSSNRDVYVNIIFSSKSHDLHHMIRHIPKLQSCAWWSGIDLLHFPKQKLHFPGHCISWVIEWVI